MKCTNCKSKKIAITQITESTNDIDLGTIYFICKKCGLHDYKVKKDKQ
jgi:Zn finger protein HypA/HybF involved in hydrogenase expression